MAYRVDLTARAIRNLRRIYKIINAEYSMQAREWFEGLERVVFSLETNPARGPATPEDNRLRHVFYGRGRNTYRIIYTVDVEQRSVTVLHIRHGARDQVAPERAD